MAEKKNKKIIRYRKPINLNIGMIIFAIIFIYMAFSVSSYMRREKVQFYEVVEGNIVNDKDYTGIILREEIAKNAAHSGYVHYYVREGKRASVGTRVYSLDETGNIATFLEENATSSATSLSNVDLVDLKKQLSLFSLSYSNQTFRSVYDMKYTLEASALEYANLNALDNLDQLMTENGINFQQIRADDAGVVSYVIDSYETLMSSQITAEMFDRSTYTKSIKKSGDLVEQATPLYKLITSDNWSIVFPLSAEEISLYLDQTSLTVTFHDINLTTSGQFSMLTGADGASYGKLDFSKYMVKFTSERFINFEIISEQAEGLKIPISAVTTKNFHTIPVEYLTQGGDTKETGFNKESYSETGTSVVFVPTTIYYSTEDSYYIDMGEQNQIKAGDYIVEPNSSNRYQVGASASLEGVYNINKGYSIFKQIEVLASNSEYHIIRKNMDYGLSVYDHIVLNPAMMQEGTLIYQ